MFVRKNLKCVGLCIGIMGMGMTDSEEQYEQTNL